jgi:hypothetical protein
MELSELNSSSNSILLTSQSNYNYSNYSGNLNNFKSSSINSRPVKINENSSKLNKIKLNENYINKKNNINNNNNNNNKNNQPLRIEDLHISENPSEKMTKIFKKTEILFNDENNNFKKRENKVEEKSPNNLNNDNYINTHNSKILNKSNSNSNNNNNNLIEKSLKFKDNEKEKEEEEEEEKEKEKIQLFDLNNLTKSFYNKFKPKNEELNSHISKSFSKTQPSFYKVNLDNNINNINLKRNKNENLVENNRLKDRSSGTGGAVRNEYLSPNKNIEKKFEDIYPQIKKIKNKNNLINYLKPQYKDVIIERTNIQKKINMKNKNQLEIFTYV